MSAIQQRINDLAQALGDAGFKPLAEAARSHPSNRRYWSAGSHTEAQQAQADLLLANSLESLLASLNYKAPRRPNGYQAEAYALATSESDPFRRSERLKAAAEEKAREDAAKWEAARKARAEASRRNSSG